MQIARTKMMSSQVTMLQIVQTLLLVLLASSNYYSCVNAVFLSIDCGGSDSYTDTNSIKWVGDDDYVRNGDSRLVQFSSSLPDVVNTLRAFPTLKRNCYTINSLDGGQRILVRASFYYGNYDGKDSPPTFELQFDGNYWTKVNMSKHLSFEVVNYEVIYTVNKITNSTSICLTQTLPDQIPFITALELRSLGGQMYAHVASHYALFRQTRIALGAYQTVRYPEDAYDRKWAPGYGFGLEEVTSEAVSIDVSTAEDSPPETVLKNATTANNTLEYIRLITNLPDFDVPVYITTYFSEVTQTKQQRRSFQLCVDDKPYSKPIIPPFGSVAEVYITNITASYNTSFTLVATSDSTLPPLINAFEIYSISDALTPGTHFKDVEGLAALQMQFQVLLAWTGDPCLPSPFTWEWVECSTHAIPRVTALNLSSFGLFGSLPDFSSMDALVTIDLHNNSLDGPIPDFLGSFPMLKLLDLSDNRFNGTVPTSLITNKKLEFLVSGNCLSGMSCPPPPPPPPETRRPKPTAPPLISNSENKKSPPPPPETRRPKPTAPPLISISENKKSPPDENNFDDNVPFYTTSTSASAANINISNQLFLFIYICLVAFF